MQGAGKGRAPWSAGLVEYGYDVEELGRWAREIFSIDFRSQPGRTVFTVRLPPGEPPTAPP